MEFLSRNPDVVQIHAAFTAGTDGMNEGEINKKVAAITGLQTLNPAATESIEVVNHIPGGSNEIHVDSVSGITAETAFDLISSIANAEAGPGRGRAGWVREKGR